MLSLPQLQLANYEKRNLITTANEQMQLAAHAACNMQQLATCSVRCVCVRACVCCAVFASCLCQILWPKGAFEMKSTGNCNCPKIFDALLMRLAMLHYLPREGQLNLLTHTHTHAYACPKGVWSGGDPTKLLQMHLGKNFGSCNMLLLPHSIVAHFGFKWRYTACGGRRVWQIYDAI